jgi:3-hydroxyisobutyrate dehydrogenase
MMQIGFVGLGHMGKPMAINLLKAGFAVKVFDLAEAAMQELVVLGAFAAKSIHDVAHDADVLITMLQTGEQVQSVCLGNDGLFAHAKSGILYIDCSSIEIVTTQQLHEAAEKNNITMVDAPVSGGVAGAEAATLTFMVGGSDKNFIKAQSLLEKMGKKVIHAGIAGHGQAAKICNNLILGISMIAVCEGFNLGKKLGLDPKKFFEISSNASGQCWAMTSYCPVPGIVEKTPSNNDYKAGFMTKMMLKDLHLAECAAEHVGAAIPLGAEATALYHKFMELGNGEVDFSGIIGML